MTTTLFTFLFILFLGIETLVKLWLSSRQIRHVSQHRNAVPAEFSEKISLHSHQRAADYTVERMKLGITEWIFDAMILIGFTLLGGLHLLDIFLQQQFSADMWRQLALLASVSIITGLLHLPFSLWRQFKLEAKYGFNRMTLKLFISDSIKGLVISLILGLPLMAAILWLMAEAGNAWWFWAWALWVGFNVLILYLYPTFIAPLFNKFTPLDNPELAERINKLATRCGFTLNGLFVMDGSKRSAHGNAYFTGFGKSRRIVFFDTLLNKLNGAEIEAVLAHELGHFKHKHIIKRMLISFFIALVFFALLGYVKNTLWFYEGLGVMPSLERNNDALALILFFMAVPVFTFLLSPLASWFSRKDEFQADQYASQQAEASSLVSALVKLYDDNAATLTPDPIHSAFYDSHPPASIRIRHLLTGSKA
ncbi:M48 family metallopeptidase [Advenella sp. WQ 585]|uniref:M48 family metallopeptidase n=1 Tax=Advenella mandrilli TaxID=2800330 RepID=A0ABS1E9Y7_9BURK|nr:M48 family metallopeptidase [Advenella mandrilli]MBK1780662.1 M48 family metallopeptidase [Advenella mandrilli]